MALPTNLAPGTYYLGALTDYNSQMAETNESNNAVNVVQITVTAPGTHGAIGAGIHDGWMV